MTGGESDEDGVGSPPRLFVVRRTSPLWKASPFSEGHHFLPSNAPDHRHTTKSRPRQASQPGSYLLTARVPGFLASSPATPLHKGSAATHSPAPAPQSPSGSAYRLCWMRGPSPQPDARREHKTRTPPKPPSLKPLGRIPSSWSSVLRARRSLSMYLH